MNTEFTSQKPQLSRCKHALSFDDRFWDRLGEVADKHYGGNRSRALEGLLLYDWLVELNKIQHGQEHTHWISAPVVLNDGELDPLLGRLARGEVDQVGSYVDRLVELRARALEPAAAATPAPPPRKRKAPRKSPLPGSAAAPATKGAPSAA